jgi:hypothetical protein
LGPQQPCTYPPLYRRIPIRATSPNPEVADARRRLPMVPHPQLTKRTPKSDNVLEGGHYVGPGTSNFVHSMAKSPLDRGGEQPWSGRRRFCESGIKEATLVKAKTRKC